MTDLEANCQFVTVKITGEFDPSKPVPLRLKRDEESPNLWATPDGKRVFASEEWALKSMEMDTQEYKDRQSKRIAMSRLVRAEVVEDYDGWVTVTGDEDDYAEDVSSLLEKYEECEIDEGSEYQPPAWAHCCTEDVFDFDLEAQLDCYLQDNHHENAREFLLNEKRLWEFWNAWAARQTLKSYMIDTKRIVVIDRERYEAELAAAKAWLEENQ